MRPHDPAAARGRIGPRLSIGGLLLGGWGLLHAAAVPAPIAHDLRVRLDPDQGRIEVEDRIDLPAAADDSPRRLLLHRDLTPRISTPGTKLVASTPAGEGVARAYHLYPAPERTTLTIRYAGRIRDPITERGEGFGRSHPVTSGIIAPEGVFLGASSHWVPRIGDGPLRFRLQVDLPPGWDAVSQGRGMTPRRTDGGTRVVWEETHPQQEVVLVAGPFHRYRDAGAEAGAVAAEVFLRTPDTDLAQRYLGYTRRYLDRYSRLLGPYPYAKFALVENFWATGYGMPSFTLLGGRVLRLPFIPRTSYPHEIVHNWWGNGVYLDDASGNWSEGLTTYLADHLLAEEQGGDTDYRRNALQRYRDFAAEGRDFPLGAFRGRHGPVTQAVGYGKAMMVFHMLRRRLGDEGFLQGLRRFYAEYRFRQASWADLQRVFEAVAGEDLDGFFRQWLDRPGAPALSLERPRAVPERAGWRLRARVRQRQAGPAYRLEVPVAVQVQGRERAIERTVVLDGEATDLDWLLPERPLRVRLDPRFDLFRDLDPAEVPPALSRLFGARRVLVVLPAKAPEALRAAYRRLADSWRGPDQDRNVVLDTDLDRLPVDRAVWVLGWDNRFRPEFEQARPRVAWDSDGVRFGDQRLKRTDAAVVLVGETAGGMGLAWLGAADPSAHAGLARKLPHYGKYGYLAFVGQTPDNRLKGEWDGTGSAAWRSVIGPGGATAVREVPDLRLPPRPSLVDAGGE